MALSNGHHKSWQVLELSWGGTVRIISESHHFKEVLQARISNTLLHSWELLQQFTPVAFSFSDGEKFWDVPSRDGSPGSGPVPLVPGEQFWTPPIIIRSQDVEATSYALLTIAERGDTTDGLPVIKWLAQQRNPTGGYASTQDTVSALKALSEFAELIYSPTSNVAVVVNAPNFRQSFAVSRSSALILQSTEVSINFRPSALKPIARKVSCRNTVKWRNIYST